MAGGAHITPLDPFLVVLNQPTNQQPLVPANAFRDCDCAGGVDKQYSETIITLRNWAALTAVGLRCDVTMQLQIKQDEAWAGFTNRLRRNRGSCHAKIFFF